MEPDGIYWVWAPCSRLAILMPFIVYNLSALGFEPCRSPFKKLNSFHYRNSNEPLFKLVRLHKCYITQFPVIPIFN